MHKYATKMQVAGYFRNMALGISAGAGYIRQVAVKGLNNCPHFAIMTIILISILIIIPGQYL